MKTDSAIWARGITKVFRQGADQVPAVTSLDLDVAEGEIVGVLGPNGAGKTTTMRMLTTLLHPTSGEATVAGCDLLADPTGVRARIGYVAQSSGVAPDNRALEELVLQGRLYGLTKAVARGRAISLLDEFDLAGMEQRPIKSLSGGQCRRLDLALGLIHAPRMMFLDEPTVGLDPQSRANLWKHVLRLKEENGASIVLSTHYLDEADFLADRIFVLDRGTVVAVGTPDELKSAVSFDRITLTVAEEDLLEAGHACERLGGVREPSAKREQITFRVPGAASMLPHLIRALDSCQVEASAIEITRPSLDDVFFSLTGRTLRDSSEHELELLTGGVSNVA
ncbi:ATP-binding cassette domain-containing protein [Lentzea sp. NPDC006480]|uniref:ATP-binding cassette domain-containing protein n=1 Tax=Lentzea sp. NPDC006480 TaxID=3157176 RepID=UPI0033AABAC1